MNIFSLRLLIIINFFLLVTLLSCGTIKPIEYRKLDNLRLEKVGFTTTSLKMNLNYYNPNSFGLKLNQTETAVYIEGILLGQTSQDHQIIVPAKSSFSIPITMDVVMKNLLKMGWVALKNKEVSVKITGNARIQKGKIQINFPIQYEEKQKISGL